MQERRICTKAPDLWNSLNDDEKKKFNSPPGGIWALGPGLVPKPLPEHDPYGLIGGSPLNLEDVFGVAPFVYDPGHTLESHLTVELFSTNNFLAAYWLGRHRGLIIPRKQSSPESDHR